MRHAIIIAAFTCACGGGDDECGGPSGRYLVRYQEVPGGTCGALSDEVVDETFALLSAPELPCVGSVSYTEDLCGVVFDFTCPEPLISDTAQSQSIGSMTWATSGESADGSFQASIRDGVGTGASTLICSSDYDFTMERFGG